MRVAQRVQQWTNKNATVEDQELKFTIGKPKKSMAQRVAASKAAWIGGVKAYQDQYREQGLRSSRGKRV